MPNNIRQQIENDLKAIDRFMSIDRKSLTSYIPGRSPVKSFKILLKLYSKPRITATAIKRAFNSYNSILDDNLSHLLQLGLIEPKVKARRITQINAWKCDKVYVVTSKGKELIFSVFERKFEAFYEENTEITHRKAS